ASTFLAQSNANHGDVRGGLALQHAFYINPTAATEIYTLSLHDALPISARPERVLAEPGFERWDGNGAVGYLTLAAICDAQLAERSEEHTSELQSPYDLVCRLLLEKKKLTLSLQKQVGGKRVYHSPLVEV